MSGDNYSLKSTSNDRSLQPFMQEDNPASSNTHAVCDNLVHKQQILQFKVYL